MNILTYPWRHNRVVQIGIGAVAILGICAVSAILVMPLVFTGRIYPGVQVNGVAVGNMAPDRARAEVARAFAVRQSSQISIIHNGTALRLPMAQLGASPSPKAVTTAARYGRTGSLLQRWHAALRALFARPTVVTGVVFDNAKLLPIVAQLDADTNRPVVNASLRVDGSTVGFVPAQAGQRLDTGSLIAALKVSLASTNPSAVRASVYPQEPTINQASLAVAKTQADTMISGPITLKAAARTTTIDVATIVSWIQVGQTGDMPTLIRLDNTKSYFGDPDLVPVQLVPDAAKIGVYVADFARTIDQEGQDAALTIADSRATVFRPSRDGITLDQPGSVQAITTALVKTGESRSLALKVNVKKPAVNEANLNDLGIKELISEGISFFPGSSSARLTNVRVGQSRYNGVLIKPDEVFSFGAQLGEVGPAQGYQPSLVIIGNIEEKQYGGGLCQVSSTLYRAALNAGLPIVQRVNHSFAINEFYTQPYGAPGVDATIYYPQVDLKFKNDTGSYILIQTVMQGTSLKFQMYGTKTKTGVIRGPQFISGSMDATKPSKTVFYRDVLDLAGKVIKTDTVTTSYKSSLDFTIVDNKQFN